MLKKIIALFLLILFFPSVSAITTLELLPHDIVVDTGQTFDIELYLTPGEEIDTVATDLITWDAGIIDCISIKQGELFNNSLVWIEGTIDNSTGKITNMVWGSQYPTSNPENYIILTFKSKKDGYANITVDSQHFGIARIGIDIECEIINNVVVVSGNPQVNPSFTLPINEIYVLLIFIIIAVITTTIFLLLKKRKKPKNISENEKDDYFS
jgi:hypothetical protein